MRTLKPGELREGVWPVFKPVGPTSHDVINFLRRITGVRRIGHAGTLDPNAEGVLVVAIGREATKTLSLVVKGEKEYLAVIRLGAVSTTDDATGILNEAVSATRPTRAAVQEAIKAFIGHIRQIPPPFSAVKVQGQEAYKRARRGETFTLKPRNVFIAAIVLEQYVWPDVFLRVTTGPGVYIRALARDLGKALDSGGYLWSLTRTRVGVHTLEGTFDIGL